MKNPQWVRDDVVLAIHGRQLAEHGGTEGVRDEGLLESALNRPKFSFQLSNPKPDLATLAAAYGFGIAKKHPFADGNKRVAYAVTRTFLLLNGVDIAASQQEIYLTFLRLAEGAYSEEELAAWIRERMEKAQ